MAKAATNGLAGKVLGAGLALSAAFAPSTASAQDVAMAALPDAPQETVDTILCETDRQYFAKDGWRPETADLHCASTAASEYAENNPGVGVLIHVGGDLPNDRFKTPDEFGRAVVHAFQSRYGVDAAYFLRQNDTRATGITFHVGEFIHGGDNGTEVKNVKEALDAMPEVAGLLELIWNEKLVNAAQLQVPTVTPGG
ncbi:MULTISPECIES: hypothetical protein [Actibacterium]|nr:MULTISPECIES: hypothetical protein [Actibacterium]